MNSLLLRKVFVLLFIATTCFANSGSHLRFVPIDTKDNRAVFEMVIEVESRDFLTRRTDSIFLIPNDEATSSERLANKAVVQSGLTDKGNTEASGHNITVWGGVDSFEVEIKCEKFSKQIEIERSIAFSVGLLEPKTGFKSGIWYQITWKEVNPKVNRTSQPKHGEDQRAKEE